MKAGWRRIGRGACPSPFAHAAEHNACTATSVSPVFDAMVASSSSSSRLRAMSSFSSFRPVCSPPPVPPAGPPPGPCPPSSSGADAAEVENGPPVHRADALILVLGVVQLHNLRFIGPMTPFLSGLMVRRRSTSHPLRRVELRQAKPLPASTCARRACSPSAAPRRAKQTMPWYGRRDAISPAFDLVTMAG